MFYLLMFQCPVFALAWTPEGRRLVTGASSGEFTLWNGLTFNFETILKVSIIWFKYALAALISSYLLVMS